MTLDLIDTTPAPYDPNAEKALLGACMLDRRIHDQLTDTITGPDFYNPTHEWVWNTITTLIETGQPADPITVHHHLTAQGHTLPGGSLDLADMIAAVDAPANATSWARIVHDHALRRRTLQAATKVRQLAIGAGDDVQAMIEAAQATLDLIDTGTPRTATTVADTITGLIDRLGNEDLLGTPTPWEEINQHLGGLQNGRLYAIGARPGVGKSLLAQGLAEHWATHHEQRVYFATVEMPARELSMRMLSHATQIGLTNLKRGRYLTEADWARIAAATSTMTATHARITVCDDPVQSVATIRQGARALHRHGGLGLVIVDYLQLLEPPPGARSRNREREVAEMSRGLKRLAMELDVPVVVLSQLNRAMTSRADKKPTMADLRESGAIEQDCDAIVLLHQPDEDTPSLVDALIVKNRDGAPGTGRLIVQGWHSTIIDRPKGTP